jgi:hypothetical protein
MTDYATLVEWVRELVDAAMIALLAQIVLNTAIAVLAAHSQGKYEWARLGEFLWRKVAPLSVTYLLVKLFGEAAGLPGLNLVVYAVLEATLLGQLSENLKTLGVMWAFGEE